MGRFGKPWSVVIEGGRIKKEGIGRLSVSTGISNGSNKRVKNARKVENLSGEKFDSSLEMYMDSLLKKLGVEYERQYRFLLIPQFDYGGETVRAMAWYCDFWIPKVGMIIDTKGWSTEVFDIKWKVFRYNLVMGRYAEDIRAVKFARTKAQCVILSVELGSLYFSNKT